jgi:PAS domain S-box-containing protein
MIREISASDPIEAEKSRATSRVTYAHSLPTAMDLKPGDHCTERQQSEEMLKKERDFIYAVLDTVSALIVALDPQGRIVRFNRACERTTGYSFDEVKGKHIWDLFLVPEDLGPVKAVFETLQSTQLPNQYTNHWLTKDGDRRLIKWSNTVLLDDAGSIEFIIGTGIDVTEQTQAENEIKQRNQEFTVLNEISQAITSTLNLEETLTLVTNHTTRLLDVAATSLLLYDQEQDDLWFAAGSGRDADFVVGKRLALGRGIAGWVFQHGEPVLVPDVSKDPRFFDGFDRETGFETRSMLCVPLRSKGHTIGAIEAMNKRSGPFDREDLRLLSSLAAPAATAIENARLFEQVRSGRERLQALSRRLVEVQEAERRHISRELHDETGQALSSLLLGLSLLEREADRPQAVIARANELENMVDEVLNNLHRLAMNLRPASLDHLGLMSALENLIESFGKQHGLNMQFETVGLDSERLPPAVETALYRIVQEALTNVIRHAQATRVDVLLERRDDQIVTIVEDDGVGFDPHEAVQSGRMGIFGMRERAEMLDGTLVIESTVGTGTTVFVEVPYAYQDPDR